MRGRLFVDDVVVIVVESLLVRRVGAQGKVQGTDAQDIAFALPSFLVVFPACAWCSGEVR